MDLALEGSYLGAASEQNLSEETGTRTSEKGGADQAEADHPLNQRALEASQGGFGHKPAELQQGTTGGANSTGLTIDRRERFVDELWADFAMVADCDRIEKDLAYELSVVPRPGSTHRRKKLLQSDFTQETYTFQELVAYLDERGVISRSTAGLAQTLERNVVVEEKKEKKVGFFAWMQYKLNQKFPGKNSKGQSGDEIHEEITVVLDTGNWTPREWMFFVAGALMALLGILLMLSFSLLWTRSATQQVEKDLSALHTALLAQTQTFENTFLEQHGTDLEHQIHDLGQLSEALLGFDQQSLDTALNEQLDVAAMVAQNTQEAVISLSLLKTSMNQRIVDEYASQAELSQSHLQGVENIVCMHGSRNDDSPCLTINRTWYSVEATVSMKMTLEPIIHLSSGQHSHSPSLSKDPLSSIETSSIVMDVVVIDANMKNSLPSFLFDSLKERSSVLECFTPFGAESQVCETNHHLRRWKISVPDIPIIFAEHHADSTPSSRPPPLESTNIIQNRLVTTRTSLLDHSHNLSLSLSAHYDVGPLVEQWRQRFIDTTNFLNFAFVRTTEIVLGGWNETTNSFDTQFTEFRFKDGCHGGTCDRFPPSSRNAVRARREQGTGWSVTPDYRPEPVMGGYAWLGLGLNMTFLIERDVAEIQGRGLDFLVSVTDFMNSRFLGSIEIEIVQLVGAPSTPYFFTDDHCETGVDCYYSNELPVVGEGLDDLIFRYGCEHCQAITSRTSIYRTGLAAALTIEDAVGGTSASTSESVQALLVNKSGQDLESRLRGEKARFRHLTQYRYESHCLSEYSASCSSRVARSQYQLSDRRDYLDLVLTGSNHKQYLHQQEGRDELIKTSVSTGTGKDYRGGETVIFVLGFVANYSIGLAVKVDRTELLTPILRTVGIAIAVCIVFVVCGVLFVLLSTNRSLAKIERIATVRYNQLTQEKEKFTLLIRDVLPSLVANRFLAGQAIVAESVNVVATCATDLCSFSDIVRQYSHRHVIRSIAYYHGLVDAVCDSSDLVKLRTVGDTHYAIAVPNEDSDHHQAYSNHPALRAMRHAVGVTELFSHSNYTSHPHLASLYRDFWKDFAKSDKQLSIPKIRVALHIGPLVMGVADDRRRVHFDCYGPAMHVTARVMTSVAEGRIGCSSMFKDALAAQDPQGLYVWDSGRRTNTRWHGPIPTYMLLSSKQPIFDDVVSKFGLERNLETFPLDPEVQRKRGIRTQ